MKKLLLILILSLFVFNSVFSQNIYQRVFGGTGNEQATGIVQTYDGGFAILYSSSNIGNGQTDILVTRLDANGDTLWTKAYGTTAHEYYYDISQTADSGFIMTGMFYMLNPNIGLTKLDKLGNIEWSKNFSGGFNENGTSCYQTSDGGYVAVGFVDINGRDAAIIKTNNLGDTLWTKTYGGSGEEYFYGSIQANDGNLINVGTTTSYGAGGNDGYIVKTNLLGDTLWTKVIGTPNYEFIYKVCQLADGNFVACGTSNQDVCALKFDGAGTIIWSKTYGGSGNEYATSIIPTNDGGAMFIGATTSFGSGNNDVYTIKITTAGDTVWTKTYGGIYSDYADDVIQTQDNGFLITGTTHAFSSTNADAYLIKIDRNGKSGCNEKSTATLVNNMVPNVTYGGNIINSGMTDNIMSLNIINVAITNSTLCLCTVTTATINPTACNSYTSPSGNYTWTGTGTYMDTILNNAGCDSVITINLTINYSNTGTDVITACDSYTWIDGNTYTANNNNATDTLANYLGCDSVITLNLTINYSNTGTDVITACDSYIWIDGNTYTVNNNTATDTLVNYLGCDSVITLNLTINYSSTGTDVIPACDSYTWIDGNTYTANNNTATYTYIGGAVNGCDSTATLNLTINSVDTTVTNNSPTLIANATGATYQWLDCNNNHAIIPGETSQIFTTIINGIYAVEVDNGLCKDTSACYAVSTVGIVDITSSDQQIQLYPNPARNTFIMQAASKGTLEIYIANGQILLIENINVGTNEINTHQFSNGIYSLRFVSKQCVAVKKLMIHK